MWSIIALALIGLISGSELNMMSGYEVRWFFESIIDDLRYIESANIPFLAFKLFVVWLLVMAAWQLVLRPIWQSISYRLSQIGRWLSSFGTAREQRKRQKELDRQLAHYETERAIRDAQQQAEATEQERLRQAEMQDITEALKIKPPNQG